VDDDGWALARIRELLSAWNRRDWSAVEALYAPDIAYDGPDLPAVVGRPAMQRRDQAIAARVPDLHCSEPRITGNGVNGKWAIFKFVQSGTPSSDLTTPNGSVLAKGSRFEIETTLLVRFDELGRVAGLRTAHT
jgi:hypothetical protein